VESLQPSPDMGMPFGYTNLPSPALSACSCRTNLPRTLLEIRCNFQVYLLGRDCNF